MAFSFFGTYTLSLPKGTMCGSSNWLDILTTAVWDILQWTSFSVFWCFKNFKLLRIGVYDRHSLLPSITFIFCTMTYQCSLQKYYDLVLNFLKLQPSKVESMTYRNIKLYISTWIFCFMADLHVWRQTHFVSSAPSLLHSPTTAMPLTSFSDELQTTKISWLLTPFFSISCLIHVNAVLLWPLKCFWNQGIWDCFKARCEWSP